MANCVTINETRSWLDGPCDEMRHSFRHDGVPIVIGCRFLERRASRFPTTASFSHPSALVTRLFLPVDGSAYITANGRDYTLDNNGIYLLPAGMAFETRYECRVLPAFHLQVYDETGGAVFDPAGGIREMRDDTLRRVIVDAVMSGDSPSAEAWAFVAVLKLASPELGIVADRHRRTERFRAVIAEVEQRPTAELTVESLAALANMTPSAASKAFRRATGVPLKRFLLDGLMRRAKELLTYSELSVASIADRLCYGEISYFSRAFKRETGMTPMAYRNATRTARMTAL